jgi:hypothetical protein
MPSIRKLNRDEVRTIERRTLGLRRAIEAEYDAFLRDFAPGDYGEAALETGDKRLTVRNRLKAAAGRHDPPLQLTFARTRASDVVRFKVSQGEEQAPAAKPAAPAPVAAASVASDAPPARRPGRPRKAASAESVSATPARRGRKPKSA